mmetsp:Transcript_38246/g.95772  ORF Transcript_38246/g.95772 Transcript_38246/m.95772 type:complete len:317 (-) Transcript_38246:92-1042(-)
MVGAEALLRVGLLPQLAVDNHRRLVAVEVESARQVHTRHLWLVGGIKLSCRGCDRQLKRGPLLPSVLVVVYIVERLGSRPHQLGGVELLALVSGARLDECRPEEVLPRAEVALDVLVVVTHTSFADDVCLHLAEELLGFLGHLVEVDVLPVAQPHDGQVHVVQTLITLAARQPFVEGDSVVSRVTFPVRRQHKHHPPVLDKTLSLEILHIDDLSRNVLLPRQPPQLLGKRLGRPRLRAEVHVHPLRIVFLCRLARRAWRLCDAVECRQLAALTSEPVVGRCSHSAPEEVQADADGCHHGRGGEGRRCRVLLRPLHG